MLFLFLLFLSPPLDANRSLDIETFFVVFFFASVSLHTYLLPPISYVYVPTSNVPHHICMYIYIYIRSNWKK
jgi:hypothetical protein